jgi:hypothetical protein
MRVALVLSFTVSGGGFSDSSSSVPSPGKSLDVQEYLDMRIRDWAPLDDPWPRAEK